MRRRRTTSASNLIAQRLEQALAVTHLQAELLEVRLFQLPHKVQIVDALPCKGVGMLLQA